MDPLKPASRHREVYRGTAGQPTRSSPLMRLVTDRKFARRAVRYALGLPVPMETEDRRILEGPIFTYFSERRARSRILFVGCDWYTKHYERHYFRGCEFSTLDPLPHAKKYGARRHVVAPLQDLHRYFPEQYFDVIICNGVYGFGLDDPEDCEAAFSQCYSRLFPRGQFVFGWNDIPERTPVPLSQLHSLSRFERFHFPPLGTWRYLTDTPYRHTYDFYCR
jgi:hypothetical protein